MTNYPHMRKYLLIGLLSFCSQAVIFTSAVNVAQAAEKTEKVSAKVGKPLKKARDLMAQKKWKEALAATQEVAAMPGKTPTEEAIVNETLAYCMMNLKDNAGAVAVYEKMLAANQFKLEDVPKRHLTVSQLHLSLKNYPKSIQYAQLYLKQNSEDLEVQRLLAETYYLNNDFVNSEATTQTLLKTAKQKGVPITEEWLKLLLSAQYKQDKKAEIVSTLERLLVDFPNAQYWSNMFTYAADSSFSDRQIMMYLRLMHARDLMTQNEYIEMAELALATNSPGDAKTYLEEGFSKGKLGTGEQKDREIKLLNLAKKQAAEDIASLPSLEQEAATKPTGEALVKIGEAYLGHGQYQNAINAFSKGLQKGGIKNQDDVHINMGTAYLALNKKGEAIQAFKVVAANSKLALMSRLWTIHAGSTKTSA